MIPAFQAALEVVYSDGDAVDATGGRACARPLSGRTAPGEDIAIPRGTREDVRELAAAAEALLAADPPAEPASWRRLADRARALLRRDTPDADQEALRWQIANAAELAGDTAAEAAAWADFLQHHPVGPRAAAVSLRLGIQAFDAIGCGVPSDPLVHDAVERAGTLLTRALATPHEESRLLATRYLAALDAFRGRPYVAAARLELAATERWTISGPHGLPEDLTEDLAAAWVLAGVVEDAPARSASLASAVGRPDLAPYLLWRLGARYAGESPPPSTPANAAFIRVHQQTREPLFAEPDVVGAEDVGIDTELLYRRIRPDSLYLGLQADAESTSSAPPPDLYGRAARRTLEAARDAAGESATASRARLSLIRLDLGLLDADDAQLSADLLAFEVRCPMGNPALADDLAPVFAGLVLDSVESAAGGSYRGRAARVLRQGVRMAETWASCFPGRPELAGIRYEQARAEVILDEPRAALVSATSAIAVAPSGSPVRREALREGMSAAAALARVDPNAPWDPVPADPARPVFARWAADFARAADRQDEAAPAAHLESAHQLAIDGDSAAACDRLADVLETWADRPIREAAASRLLALVDERKVWSPGAAALARGAAALSARGGPDAAPLAARLAEAAVDATYFAGLAERADRPAEERADWMVDFLGAHPGYRHRDAILHAAAALLSDAGRWDLAVTVWTQIVAPTAPPAADIEAWARARAITGDYAGAAESWLRLAEAADRADAALEAAGIRLAVGDRAGARVAYEAAIHMGADRALHARAWLGLARIADDVPAARAAAAHAYAEAPVGTPERALAAWMRLAQAPEDAGLDAAAEATLDDLPHDDTAVEAREAAGRLRVAQLDAGIEALAATVLSSGTRDEVLAEVAAVNARAEALLADARRLGNGGRYGATAMEGVVRVPEIFALSARLLGETPPPSDADADEAAAWRTSWATTTEQSVDGVDALRITMHERLGTAAAPLYLPASERLAAARYHFPELATLGGPLRSVGGAAHPSREARATAAGDPAVRAAEVGALLDEGRIAEARLALTYAPEGPPDATLLALHGIVALREGEPVRALGALREALTLDPGQPIAARALGLLALRSGDFARAAPLLAIAPQQDPTDRLALALAQAGAAAAPGPWPPVEGADPALSRRLDALTRVWFRGDLPGARALLRADPPDDPLRQFVDRVCGSDCDTPNP